MASSSSSSSYDVFLNFRGPDTHDKFVRPLYDALIEANISAYLDREELPMGETIKEELVRAIKNSKISIPIFSKNYAWSKYCLLELVEIWRCNFVDGQIVIPIFIDVEPMDVKYQLGSFQEPFEKYQRNHEPAINRWRNALTEVGNISGRVILNGDADPEELLNTIKSVVARVSREVHRTPLEERRHIIGVDFHVNKVIDLLHIGSDDVRFVGICGMSGVGKTTIAEVVCDRIGRRFNRSSFLRDVNQNAAKGNAGLVLLQKKLLRDILKREYDISDISYGESYLSKNIHEKTVLLILDGVEEVEQLNSLAGGRNWFGPRSKVIITAKDTRILKVHGMKVEEVIQIHTVEEMNPNNSLRLFSLHTFSNERPPENYKQLSIQMVSFVGGLPLALEVLGRYLIQKGKKDWTDTLKILEDISSIKEYDDKVFATLLISFKKLSSREKTIFLDIACNFSGHWWKTTLISIWEACTLYSRLAINGLIEKHLLKVDGDDEYGRLRMHDQLRYLGKKIVLQRSSGNLTKRIRLWSQDDIWKVLKRDMGNQKMVEGILIDENFKFEGDDGLSYEDFEHMPNLRFLRVHKHNLNGDCLRLPSALKWFYWGGSNACENVPTNFYHEELVHLEISSRCLELAWNDAPQNNEKRFKKLMVLTLKRCRELSLSPNFLSWFPCLESLEIDDCSSPFVLPDCICQMWPSLKILTLSQCNSFNKLPTTIGDLKHLVKLSIYGTEIEEIPDGVGQLQKLEELDVLYCSESGNLVKLPTSMGRMRSLRHLKLAGTMIEKLPHDFSNLSSLEVLHMPRGICLQPVPITMAVFSQLQELCLSECITTPESILKLPLTLTALIFLSCHSLQMILDLSYLERLQIFKVDSCECLEHLESLPLNLITLMCHSCKSLVRLPNLSKLKILNAIEIRDCENLEKIQGLEGTESLESLSAMGCNKITGTTKKTLGQGRLRDNSGEGRESTSIIADDENYNYGSPILCVVFEAPLMEEVESCDVYITAFIRRGEKTIECNHQMVIEDIDFSTYRQDIIYIHHFEMCDWFGLPLESKDAIEEIRGEIFYTFKYDDDNWEIGAKYVKVLFENKESDQQMPDQQSSARLVADFFIWDDDDNNNSSEEDDDEDDYEEDQDDDADNNNSSKENDDEDDHGEEQDDDEDDQQTLEQPSHLQEKGKTSLKRKRG